MRDVDLVSRRWLGQEIPTIARYQTPALLHDVALWLLSQEKTTSFELIHSPSRLSHNSRPKDQHRVAIYLQNSFFG